MSLNFHPFNEDELVIGQNFSSVISADAGQTFEVIKTPFFVSTGRLSMFENGGTKHLYYGAQYGYIHKDMTAQTETARDIKALNAYGSFYPTMIFPDKQQEGRIYKYTAGFMGSSLSISTDHGATYSVLAPSITQDVFDLKNDPANPNQIWVSYSDFGQPYLQKINFDDISAPEVIQINPPSTAVIRKIQHTGTSSGDMLVLAGDRLYRTADAGNSWTEITAGLSEVNGSGLLFDIAQNPFQSNQLALATSAGIFSSADGGQTWSQKTTNEVNRVEYSDTSDGKLVAANYTTQTGTFALYFSADNSETWTTVDAEKIANVQSSSVYTDFTGNNATVYIATSDLGLVTYDLAFGALGVDTVSGSSVKVYPNLTSAELYIDAEVQSAMLFDMSGRRLLETRKSGMNVSALNPGMYLLKIRTKDNKEVTRKIIKK